MKGFGIMSTLFSQQFFLWQSLDIHFKQNVLFLHVCLPVLASVVLCAVLAASSMLTIENSSWTEQDSLAYTLQPGHEFWG